MFIVGSQRRKFTPGFKDWALKLVVNTGRPGATVARELGIVEQTLGKWVAAYRANQTDGDGGLNETERAELARRLSVSRSGFYAWQHRGPSKLAVRRERIEQKLT
jgi:transposase-like protein